MNEASREIDVLILAAGLGTRMRSDIAKVLHKIDGRPLINHVCKTAAALSPNAVYVVVGHQGENVRTVVQEAGDVENVFFVTQEKQLGTGDAVNSARELLSEKDSTLLILSGDVPMMKAETLAGMIRHHQGHRGRGAACTIMTVKLDNPTGYGRMIRDSEGLFKKIVEQKDANEQEIEVKEINAGIYCFDTRKLFAALANVKNDNAQGEYYLTDVPSLLSAAGEDVAIFAHTDAFEIEGINNRVQLADMERILRRRVNTRLMLDHGVSFIDPKNTYISESAVIGRDTVIYPNVMIEGNTEIGDGCIIRSGSRLTNAIVGHNTEILENCVVSESQIGNNCTVGPMAHLRGKAVAEDSSKIGNFVELKKTKLGRGSKASHLTYLGDATIGEKTNIGAGTITCNYDGKNKHETHIGDNVRIGSDSMLVAPLTIGDGAMTGAGSVVTNDVEANTLVVGVPARRVQGKE